MHRRGPCQGLCRFFFGGSCQLNQLLNPQQAKRTGQGAKPRTCDGKTLDSPRAITGLADDFPRQRITV